MRKKLSLVGVLTALLLLVSVGSVTALASSNAEIAEQAKVRDVIGGGRGFSQNPEEIPLTVTGLEVMINWGGSETARVGRETPVTVQVSSSGPEIRGYAAAYIPVGDGDYYVVEEDLSVAAGETKQAVLSVPVNYSTTQFTVEYRGEDGVLYATQSYTLRLGYGGQEIYIAAVGSDAAALEEMAIFDRVMLNEYQGTSTRLYSMEAEKLASEAKLLKSYDILLWVDVDVKQVSQAQLAAVKDWIYEGGILIVGQNSDLCGPVSAGEFATERWGRGIYVYCGFPLADITDLYTDGTEIRSFLYEAVGASRMNTLEENVQYGYEEYWSARSMTFCVDPERIPKVWQYALVLGVYLIVLGPVLYLTLKKKERQGMLRGAMIAVAFFFTAAVYLLGCQTRFTRPFMNYAAIQEIRDEGVIETVFSNVCSPYNTEYSFELDGRYALTPLLSYDFYSSGGNQRAGKDRLHVRHSAEGTNVTINDNIAFTPELLRLSRKGGKEYQEGFEGQLRMFEDETDGWVRNSSDRDFERVCILAGGRLFVLGEMEAGQQKELADAEVVQIPGYAYYRTYAQVAGSVTEQNILESPEMALASWRMQLVNYYIGMMMTMDKQEATILAFPSVEEVQLLQEANMELRGTTLVTALLEVDYEKDGLRYVPCLEKSPLVIQGNYDASNNSTYVRQLVLQYDLENLQVERIRLEWPEISEGGYNEQLFEGSIEFFNWKTKTYDQMEQKGGYLAGEIADYLDQDNCLTIRYVSNITEEDTYTLLLPRIAVTGREGQ